MSATRSAADRAAVMFAGVGLLALSLSFVTLPGTDDASREAGRLLGIGTLAIAAVYRLLPWERWNRWSPLVTVPLTLAILWLMVRHTSISPYVYPLFFVLLFTWVGLSYPPRTSVAISPVVALGYVLPLLDTASMAAVATAATVLPVCVLVGEVLSHHLRQLTRAQRQSDRRAGLLEATATAARRLNTLDPEFVLMTVVDVVCGDAMGFDSACFSRLDETDQTFAIVHPRNLPLEFQLLRHDGTSGITGEVRSAGATVVIPDYQNDPRAIPVLREGGFKTVVGTPVRIDGRVVAVLIGASHTWIDVDQQVCEALELLAAHAGSALANAHRYEDQRMELEEANEASRLDPLTGVGNRRHASELLQSLEHGDVVAMVDLDHFKHVNDTFGHQVGDRVLADLGRHLREALRGHDTVARYGGEEFLVVLRGAGESGSRIAERINESRRRTSPLATLSVGLASHRGGDDPTATLAHADQALYEAKKLGRDRVCMV